MTLLGNPYPITESRVGKRPGSRVFFAAHLVLAPPPLAAGGLHFQVQAATIKQFFRFVAKLGVLDEGVA